MTRGALAMRGFHLVACLLLLARPSISWPNCSTGWDWSYNSLGQNPCGVATYLEAICNGGLWTIAPLPQGRLYRGPDAGEGTLCQCNTVVYSLVSACGACQGSQWIQWSEWSLNCTSVASVSTYPESIPAGTRVPHWAYLDITTTDTWNDTAAKTAGDSPEGTAPTVPTATAPRGSGSNRNKSGIVGGVVGGIVGAALLSASVLWYLRRRRRRAEARSSMNDAPHMAEASGLSDPGTFTPPLKFYDPSDPSTFPTPFVSPSVTVIQTTSGSEQADSDRVSPPLNDRSQYSGLPLV
ncbi:hypothetical protein BJV78DRAFT_210424 [Lactifluus subvellereus]|nr:hypothetical protein BJV78DRAFT_210424 [Lactifluus subvellereus]